MVNQEAAAMVIESLNLMNLDGNILKTSWGKGKGAESMNLVNYYPNFYPNPIIPYYSINQHPIQANYSQIQPQDYYYGQNHYESEE